MPAWTLVVFTVVLAAVYSPIALHVSSILDDYDVLALKSQHFFFHAESVHMLSIARPVAALLTNLPIIAVTSPADFIWVRLFSMLTLCTLSGLLIWNCIVRLRTSAPDAVAVALATFFVPGFMYSVLDATAWAPHLLSTFFAFVAYTMLGRSNAKALAFSVAAARRDHRTMVRQCFEYFCSRRMAAACLVYQLAFYDYPPFALLVTLFPVIAVLVSGAPRAYRILIALRDIGFIGLNLALYFLSTTLIYLPFVRLFTAKGTGTPGAYENEAVENLYAAYQFKFNWDLAESFSRLGHLSALAGDLWFLPQFQAHFLTGFVLVLALVMAHGPKSFRGRAAHRPDHGELPNVARLECRSFSSEGWGDVLVVATCFLMSAAPVLAARGGFVAYRTGIASTAIAAIVFIFAARGDRAP